MNFPLQFTFKLLAFGPQIYVTDAAGASVLYVKQKLFKLREDISVFTDDTQSRLLASIKADRILDWSARYHFVDAAGQPLGGVGRQGFRSLWRASYEVFDGAGTVGSIREENPLIKILDGLLSEVPVVGALSGYFFHPAYLVTRPDGTPLLRLKKQAAFFEGSFRVEKLEPTAPDEETLRHVLALLMMILLERSRG